MLAYGFFGNIIEQSDQWRIFGPLRYTLAGIFQFIENKSYPVELIITQTSQKCNSNTINDHSKRNSSESEIRQRDVSGKNREINEKNPLPVQMKRQGRYRTVNCLNMPGRCEKSSYGMSPSVHLGDGSFDVILVKHSWYFPFFRFLHRVAKDGQTIEELSNVERFRATEVRIHPIVTREKDQGHWACDGEVIKVNEAKIRAHRQILNLFASGIRLDQIKKINKEYSNTNSISTIKQHQWIYWFILLVLLVFFSLYYIVS